MREIISSRCEYSYARETRSNFYYTINYGCLCANFESTTEWNCDNNLLVCFRRSGSKVTPQQYDNSTTNFDRNVEFKFGGRCLSVSSKIVQVWPIQNTHTHISIHIHMYVHTYVQRYINNNNIIQMRFLISEMHLVPSGRGNFSGRSVTNINHGDDR